MMGKNSYTILDGQVVFNCDGREFVRTTCDLKRKLGVADEAGIAAVIDDAFSSNPDEEQVRDLFGAGIDDAVRLAVDSFYGKKDLDQLPALLHSLEVGRAGETVDERIVGFIHDVVEDTETTFEDLERMGYTRRVIDAVRLCTRDKSVPYEDYLQRIKDSGNPTARKVKLNDLHHNIGRGKKTMAVAERENNQELLEKIKRINTKHEKALEHILK